MLVRSLAGLVLDFRQAWSSRRRDRRPRRRLLYLASRELSSLTGSSPGTRARDALEALERVGLERGVLRDVVHNHLEDLGASELLRRQALHTPGPCRVSAASPWPPPPAGARSRRRG